MIRCNYMYPSSPTFIGGLARCIRLLHLQKIPVEFALRDVGRNGVERPRSMKWYNNM